MRKRWVLVCCVLGCGGGGGDDGPRVEPPVAPADNDPAFTVSGMRGWYLIGNDLTPGDDVLQLTVVAPVGVEVVDAWVAGSAGIRLESEPDAFRLELPIDALGPGRHDVLLAADGDDVAFARLVFERSHPLYVMVSTDWDFSEPSQQALDFQDRLHDEHPAARITHFVGPYTFTDPELAEARKTELATWLIEQRDQHDDEIGLHIHPYCHFVEYAGVPCNTTDSTVYNSGDDTGYTIKVGAYGETDFGSLLDAADQLFVDNGLGKPVTFRAGGWTATIETLRALESRDYVADTSANNWARMEEWRGLANGELYEWNMQHWASIGDTSQPYYPNETDILSPAPATLSILEVPDNAIMVDYVSVDEMTDILSANWGGGALFAPTAYMMGFHPAPGFTADEQDRVDGLLDVTDQHLAAADAGPIVYAVLRDMPLVWRD